MPLPFAGCEQVFPGGVSGRVLLYNDHQLVLFDTASFQMLGAASLPGVKRVVWNADNSLLAVLSATGVRILTKDLKQLGAVTEKRRVKDCIWDERGAVLYSTLSQIKYLLPSGESGVVRSLEEPVYLICLRGSVLHVFNRESAMQKLEIDATEYLFKLSLENHRYHDAIRIIRSNKVDSQAIIGYLQRNGFEDIALYFVTEPRAKFNLALRCGKLEIVLGEGLPASQFGVAHIDRNPDFWLHKKIAETGAYLIYDGPGKVKYYPDSVRVDLLRRLVEAGFENQIMLSNDMGKKSHHQAYGYGPGWGFIKQKFIPRLLDEGFSEEVVHKFMYENPARFYAMRK